jgi:DNA-binding CsgD family transcriptional regulator
LGVELSHGLFALSNAAHSLIALGRLHEAEQLTARGLGYDVRDTVALVLHMSRAEALVRMGRAAEAERDLEASREFGAMTYSLEFATVTDLIAALAALSDGREDDARSHCSRAMTAAVAAGDELHVSAAWALGLRIEADAAERARARRRPEDETKALAAADRLDAAWNALEAGLDDKRVWSPETAANLAAAAAERLRLEGRPDPAAWAAATRAWDALGMPYPAAYARLRGAEALIGAGGGRAQPAALLADAHAACLGMGAAGLRGQVEALARRARIELGAPAAEPEPEPSPAAAFGISEREFDVLALVAEGRTNRQIADALFISVKTAGTHVSSILRKLDVATRGEAAAVAVRAGLLSDRDRR